ncbi:MAG TPA: prepilin-type N-terminal cleavage/methylation domain-containing protein [Gemmatimonadaceae bacterium]|jgi:prepilin-type N-terminal cleavage/methylation domain-containing protein|nr:prepilin-type N-terminal cleavage/methylation domain-containing protein [Gemmatimonadaceae bacterium]
MNRPGVTLVELIVVLAIVAVIAGVTTPAFRRVSLSPNVSPWVSTVNAARRTAIDSNRVVRITLSVDETPHAVTALPDGSVVTDLPVDRLTGECKHGEVKRAP